MTLCQRFVLSCIFENFAAHVVRLSLEKNDTISATMWAPFYVKPCFACCKNAYIYSNELITRTVNGFVSRYFLDNNVRQRLVHGVDKLRRPVNSTLFCHYGLFDRSLHTVKASRRDFIDNRLLVVFSIFLLISLIVARLHSLSIPAFTSYISCASSLFTGFAAASFHRDRFAIHFDRWPRVHLVFQDSGLQLRALRISTLSLSLFLSREALATQSGI